MLGGGPEPLALILARVGCPHVLPSLHLLQTVLVHFPLGEDEEEDTTGEGGRERTKWVKGFKYVAMKD